LQSYLISLKYLFTSFLLASRFVEGCAECEILVLRRFCRDGLKILSENFLGIVNLVLFGSLPETADRTLRICRVLSAGLWARINLIKHRPGQHLGLFGDLGNHMFPFDGHHMDAVDTLHLLEFLDLLAGDIDTLLGDLILLDTF